MDPLFVDQPSPDSSAHDSLFVDTPLPSKLESFGRGAINNFPLAPQAVGGLEEGDYSENLADWKAKAATAKATNPKSYGAGAVTGAVAPVFIPGAGEALEAYPIAGNAALGAANAINDTDLLKQPGEALKEAGIGAAVGAAGGKLAQSLMGQAPEKLVGMANKQAVKTLSLNPNFLGHIEPSELEEIGQFAHNNDLINGPLEQRLGKAEMVQKAYGDEIGRIGAKATPGEAPNSSNLMGKMMDYANSSNKEARGLARSYKAGIKDLIKLGDQPTFQQMQDLKSMYGNLAFGPDHSIKDKAAADVYGILKDSMKKTVQNAPKEYQSALDGYSKSNDIVNGLQKQLGAERAGKAGNGGFGMMGAIRRLPGAVRAPAGMAAAATGHPMMAAAAALPELTNPALHSNILRSAAENLPKAAYGTNQALTDYLMSKYGDSNAE